MKDASISLSLSPNTVESSIVGQWLRIAQDDDVTGDIDMGDIYEMWMLARDGQSARNFKPPSPCNVKFTEDTASIKIYFNIYPSEMDLGYSLTTSLGTIAPEKEPLETVREFGFWFNNTNVISFDRVYKNMTFTQQSPCYSPQGHLKTTPKITVEREVAKTSEDIFLVGVASGQEQGYSHCVDIELDMKDEEGNYLEITEINCTITAVWDNNTEDETAQLNLVIPQCILRALKLCGGKPSMVCHKCEGEILEVYFSTCDGEVILVRETDMNEEGENYWCETI